MDKEVKIGEVAVTKDANNLTASGVGSCLVIALYDPNLKIGALAHAMLARRETKDMRQRTNDMKQRTNDNRHPLPSGEREKAHRAFSGEGVPQDTKYIDAAIDEMLKKMLWQGAKRENLEAKLIGGANMFSAFVSDIGKQNVLSAKEKLKKEGIKLVGESVGGSQGRSVEFSAASGIVTVKMKF